ncbi:MAG: hypothetical protein E7282_04900 [Lachnospiraceae bacterium]|nr:hypothetical protein [Lachnospiraceae bacterium]
MKKRVVSALLIATMGASVLTTGCGGSAKVPTVKEIYDANKSLLEDSGDKKVTAKVTADIGLDVKSDEFASYGIASGDSLSVNADVTATQAGKVSHEEGTVDLELGSIFTQNLDVEMWTDGDKSYTYDDTTESWSVSTESVEDQAEDLASQFGLDDIESYIEELQKEIDDKDNKDATLEKDGDYFVLTYKYNLSDLADVDELSSYASMFDFDTSAFADLKGQIVFNAKFNKDNYYLAEASIEIDDTALNDIETMVQSLITVDITAFKVKVTLDYGEGTLEVPEDVISAASDSGTAVVETQEEDTTADFGGTEANESTDLNADSMMTQIFGTTYTEEEFLNLVGTDDVEIPYTTLTGEEWKLSSYTIKMDLFYILDGYSDTDTLATDLESYVSMGEDADCAMQVIAGLTAMGMMNGYDDNASTNIQNVVTYMATNCTVLDATAITTALQSFGTSMQ